MNILKPIATESLDKTKLDSLLVKIADYVHHYEIKSDEAFDSAKLCLLDSLGCAMLALHEEKCSSLLGPIVPDTRVPNGVKVPGTSYELDPIKATFDLGACIRWLDYNDTWLAKEWGHPSDNIAAILSIADFINKQNISNDKPTLTLEHVLEATIKAYEIQGILALENAFNRVGLDHVALVKIASAAVVSKMLGGGYDQTIQTVANAFLDGQSLRVYRHGTNTAQRKSWAAGDAASRGVELAWLSVFAGEPGCKNPITAETWGVEEVFLKGNKIKLNKDFGSYVIENILFKVLFPAEFHAQTAAELGINIHKEISGKFADIDKIYINTQEPAMRIINKTGELNNYADRDHCLQYITAVALLKGDLKGHHYLDDYAKNEPKIDELRSKMVVNEDIQYSDDYLDLDKRAIPNSIEIKFKDGSSIAKKELLYPIGHKNRRAESLPFLEKKYLDAIESKFSGDKLAKLKDLWSLSTKDLSSLNVSDFVSLW